MKKLLFIVFFVIVMPSHIVNAMPDESQTINLDISNISSDAAYIDLLIDISDTDKQYISFNSVNMNSYNFDSRELSEYNKEGFISLSCHYKDIITDMNIKKGLMIFADCNVTKELFANNKRIRIAVLDKKGNVIQVSDVVKLKEGKAYLYGDIKYDVKNNTITPQLYNNSLIKETYTNWFLLLGVALVLVILFVVLSLEKRKNKTKNTHNKD